MVFLINYYYIYYYKLPVTACSNFVISRSKHLRKMLHINRVPTAKIIFYWTQEISYENKILQATVFSENKSGVFPANSLQASDKDLQSLHCNLALPLLFYSNLILKVTEAVVVHFTLLNLVHLHLLVLQRASPILSLLYLFLGSYEFILISKINTGRT